MENIVVSRLKELRNTREDFREWYCSSVGDWNAMVAFLEMPMIYQLGIFLSYLAARNLAVDINKTEVKNGFNIRILDNSKMPEIEQQATFFYIPMDGDYYVAMVEAEGKGGKLYAQGIVRALDHLNNHKTQCDV